MVMIFLRGIALRTPRNGSERGTFPTSFRSGTPFGLCVLDILKLVLTLSPSFMPL